MKKSFTLIEMLVVIFILVLLIGILVVIFQQGNYQAKANDNQRKKDMAEIATAIETFKADHGHYPLINWGRGKHAAEVIYGDTTNDCGSINSTTYGTYGDLYKPSLVGSGTDRPGTEISINSNGDLCDDLSLQLLGKVYLAKMPEGSDADIIDQGTWTTTGLTPYLDDIPRDPLLSKTSDYWYVFKNNSPYAGAIPSADYDNTDGVNYLYRYLYNSYYDCPYEAVFPGDRYWLNMISQLMENGEPDTVTGLYFYEVGNANWFRHPRSECN